MNRLKETKDIVSAASPAADRPTSSQHNSNRKSKQNVHTDKGTNTSHESHHKAANKGTEIANASHHKATAAPQKKGDFKRAHNSVEVSTSASRQVSSSSDVGEALAMVSTTANTSNNNLTQNSNKKQKRKQ